MDRACGPGCDQDGALWKNARKVPCRAELFGGQAGHLWYRVEIYFPYRTGDPEPVSVSGIQ